MFCPESKRLNTSNSRFNLSPKKPALSDSRQYTKKKTTNLVQLTFSASYLILGKNRPSLSRQQSCSSSICLLHKNYSCAGIGTKEASKKENGRRRVQSLLASTYSWQTGFFLFFFILILVLFLSVLWARRKAGLMHATARGISTVFFCARMALFILQHFLPA